MGTGNPLDEWCYLPLYARRSASHFFRELSEVGSGGGSPVSCERSLVVELAETSLSVLVTGQGALAVLISGRRSPREKGLVVRGSTEGVLDQTRVGANRSPAWTCPLTSAVIVR